MEKDAIFSLVKIKESKKNNKKNKNTNAQGDLELMNKITKTI